MSARDSSTINKEDNNTYEFDNIRRVNESKFLKLNIHTVVMQ
jgi:hypothetical protein